MRSVFSAFALLMFQTKLNDKIYDAKIDWHWKEETSFILKIKQNLMDVNCEFGLI